MQIIHLIRHDDPRAVVRHQATDARILSERHEIETWTMYRDQVARTSGDVREPLSAAVESIAPALIHIYSSDLPSNRSLRSIKVPWIAPVPPKGHWLGLGKAPQPDRVRSVHPATGEADPFPEAVEPSYLEASPETLPEAPSVGGIVSDDASHALFDAVRARVTRTRDDVRWQPFSSLPSPDEIASVAVWVDFGTAARGADNGVPEALVSGRVVVAPRTRLNSERLIGGEAGFLVPQGDANEMAHVIVTALFKPEVARPRLEAARQRRDRFDPSARASLIERLYLELLP